ncbi:MAG TPA: ATP-binding protein [Bacillota bacterium]|nr:ATP-binding protein [Bacillota bacterium]
MKPNYSLNRSFRDWKVIPLLVLGLTLAVLGALIFLGTQHLRQSLRAQITAREAETLHAVALWQQLADANAPADSSAEALVLALQISRLKGVLAVRLFDDQGRFITAVPGYVKEARLSPELLAQLRQLRPASSFLKTARLSDLFFLASTNTSTEPMPLLEVALPLEGRQGTQLRSIAQLILDGRSLAHEFAQLDQHLVRQGVLAFLAGASLLTLMLAWAYRRLRHAHQLLEERTASLLRANHELTLAAKTSALGSMTAHLLHGLRNPLSGLQQFVESRVGAAQAQGDGEWQEVAATTRRMQGLVGDLVRVLAEEQGGSQYELSLAEVMEILAGKMHPAAQKTGVRFQTGLSTAGVLGNRDANLILLILENLLQNAFEATASAKTVRLFISGSTSGTVRCEVQDEGCGLPEHVRQQLFTPGRSTKPGGNGIGLAISRQLAHQLGASLELERTGPNGSVFVLVLPAALFHWPTPLPATADLTPSLL